MKKTSTCKLCEDILNELAIEHEISLFTSAEELEKVLEE